MRVSSAKAGEWAGDGLAPRASDAGRLVCEVPTLAAPPGSAWLEGSVGLDLNLYVPPDLGILSLPAVSVRPRPPSHAAVVARQGDGQLLCCKRGEWAWRWAG